MHCHRNPIALGADVVAGGADAFFDIAAFVPGAQATAAIAKLTSGVAQAVGLGANAYIGWRTRNWSAAQSQVAALGTSLLFGHASGRLALGLGGVRGRMGPAGRARRAIGFGNAAGNMMGDAASNAVCAR